MLPVCCQANHSTQYNYLVVVLSKTHLKFLFYLFLPLVQSNFFHYSSIFRTYLIYSKYSVIRFEIFTFEEKLEQVFYSYFQKKKLFPFCNLKKMSWFRRARCVIIQAIKYVLLLRMSILQNVQVLWRQFEVKNDKICLWNEKAHFYFVLSIFYFYFYFNYCFRLINEGGDIERTMTQICWCLRHFFYKKEGK